MIKNKKGFTLIELVVVIVILGILAAIGIPNYLSMLNKAKESVAVANLRQIEHSLMAKLHLASADERMLIFEHLNYTVERASFVLDQRTAEFVGMPLPTNPLQTDSNYSRKCLIKVFSTVGHDIIEYGPISDPDDSSQQVWGQVGVIQTTGISTYQGMMETKFWDQEDSGHSYAYAIAIEADIVNQKMTKINTKMMRG